MKFRTVTDQLDRTVQIPKNPQRIISLVPSQTELLFDLGSEEQVVGITKFCVHPDEWFRTKTRVGGTKQLHFDVINTLNPDIIIANKEENKKEDIDILEKEFPVWVSDVNSISSALEMISSIAEITNSNASHLIEEIEIGFHKIGMLNQPIKTLYLIWNNPYMAAGRDTFISDMMQRCGFENVIKTNRYPELSTEQITQLNPELILLSSEPYPFKEKHVSELKQFQPSATLKMVDGEMFSWYGSRMKLALSYFAALKTSIPM